MKLIIILLKAIIIIQYVLFIKTYIDIKRIDTKVHLSFGLISLMEFFCIIGLSISFLLSVIQDVYSSYLAVIGMILNIYIYFMLRRVMAVGNQFVLVKNKLIKLKNIKKIDVDFYSIQLKTKKEQYRIIYPIISHYILQDQLYNRVMK